MSTYDIIATVEYHMIHSVQLLLLFVSYLVVTVGLIYIFKKKIMSMHQRLLVAFACIIFLAVCSAVSIYNFTRIYLSYADVDLRAEVHGAFTRAMRYGDLDTIESILSSEPKLKNKDCLNRMLSDAAFSGHKHIAEYLITQGAPANTSSNSNTTPLHMAAFEGHTQIVELLVANDAEIDARDLNGMTPLHDAAANGHQDIVIYLVNKGADLNIKDNWGWTPLHWVVLSIDGNVDQSNGGKEILPSLALRLKKIFETLIKHKADVNVRGEEGKTPLGLAVESDLKDIISLLRKHGGVE
ncbi:MAG: ankyrin repeat domain-containing protein [Planctomycetota bacterium]|jgi:hypothetical protein